MPGMTVRVRFFDDELVPLLTVAAKAYVPHKRRVALALGAAIVRLPNVEGIGPR